MQNLPYLFIMVGGVAAIGTFPRKVHELFDGDKPRPVGRDDFDFLMDRRDERRDESRKTKLNL